MRKALALVALAAVASSGMSQYVLDDGTGENSIGLTNGGTFIWMNQFTVLAGANVLTSIDVAWGQVPDGTAVTAMLWSDPNGDGNPLDAQVISTIGGLTSNSDTDTFNNFNTPDVTRTVGSSFFGGFMITHVAAQFPARIDQTVPHTNRSWISIGSNPNALDPANTFNMNQLGTLNGDWMIRVNGTAVPEPATMAALGLGVVALIRRRVRSK